MLDGPVQGAEKRSTLLHHTVEVCLVKEVTLGVTEVLGAKPGQRKQWSEESLEHGPLRQVGVALAAPLLCQEAPHLRRYSFQGSDSFS